MFRTRVVLPRRIARRLYNCAPFLSSGVIRPPFQRAGSPINLGAADFSLSRMQRGGAGNLTGLFDGTRGILSLWFRVDGGDNTFRRLVCNSITDGAPSIRFLVELESTNKLALSAQSTAGTGLIQWRTTSTFAAGAAWYNFLCGWNSGPGPSAVGLINGIVDGSAVTLTAGTIAYIGSPLGDWVVGGSDSAVGNEFWHNGCLADVYFAPNQELNFNDLSNVRKFITDKGKPANLLPNGSGPTGAPPIMFHHISPGENPANFALNRGSGGNFSMLDGALTAGSTSPSD